jgi:DNA polymerase elongation subunit (family B)
VETQAQVLDADYQIKDGEPQIRLYCKTAKDEDLLAIDKEFKPYFYAIPKSNTKELKEKLEETEFTKDDEKLPITRIEETERKDGNQKKKMLQVYTDIPPNVPKLEKQVYEMPETKGCREYDIPFYKRYLIDKNLRPVKTTSIKGKEISSADFDKAIEVNSIKETTEPEVHLEELAFDLEVYKDKIIMASLASENYKKLLTTEEIDREAVEVVDDEKMLLERFIEIIKERNVDVLTGYNTDEYDFQRLRERCENYNMELSLGRDGERMKFKRRGRFSGARLKGRMHLDLYPFITHILAPGLDSETLDLDSVAQEILGKEKDEMTWEEMKQSWKQKENLEKFADYALKDAELAYQLAQEIIPQILELSRITGLISFDTCRLTYGQLTENYLLREAHKRNKVAPNRPTRSERRKRQNQGAYSGGFVYEPESGLHENIAVMDFRSLYPTVMVAHNISPDTLNLEECTDRFEMEEFDYNFCQDNQGFFPKLVEKLVKERYKLKSKLKDYPEDSTEYNSIYNRQEAQKILANSFYGYLGYNGARWYSRESAEATTYLGREYIQETIQKAEKQGYEVAYGDTDSVFLKKDNIKQEIDDFVEEVNKDLPRFMELEFEGFFKRGFFTSTDSGEGAKKKYALLKEDGSMKITGFEQVRRDWSPIAKKTQKKVLQKVLNQEIEEAAQLVKDTIQKVKTGDIPVEEMRIYTTLTKPPKEYESTAPHVEAVRKAKERGEEIEPETTVGYVITRGSGNISSRAELVKYAEDYDSEYYIENQIIPVSLRALKVFGYTEGQLLGKGKQSGLGQF